MVLFKMAIATGQSNLRAEICLMEKSIKLMIDSVEQYYSTIIDSLEIEISKIERENISIIEKLDIKRPYCNEIIEYQTQLYNTRNKIVICIYSICEPFLAEICQSNNISLTSLHSKNKKKKYYLQDYLVAIKEDYSKEDRHNLAFIVSKIIRPLRNYLIHCNPNNIKVNRILINIKKFLQINIESSFGEIKIKSKEDLIKILEICKEFLLKCEIKAKGKI